MPTIGKTSGERGDIHEEIRLHHDELGLYRLSLPVAVEQVQLHTLCQ